MKLGRHRTGFRAYPISKFFLRFALVSNVKKIYIALFSIFLLLVACEAEPTLVPNLPVDPIRPTILAPSPTLTNVPTLAPNETRVSTTIPRASPAPTVKREPSGSITIAAIGAPAREITALHDFVSRALYDSLLQVNPQTGDLIPALAESWLVSDDAKTFVFVLREDVKWHDGAPLTAEDVAFTLESLSDADIRIRPAADFGPIEKITANDARTVSVTFREPYCAALTYLGMIPILPKHLLEQKTPANLANEDLIGSGPLILENWTDEKITFTRNPNYWNGAPQIVNWTLQFFADENAASDAVQNKRADVFVTDSIVPQTQNKTFAANEFYALAMNLNRAPFDDARVRQALAFALDREQFTQALNGNAIETSLLAKFWAFPNNLTQTKFDAARARQLLAQAGWRDTDGDGIVEKEGKPFEVTLWAQLDDDLSQNAAQLAREQLSRVGVRAILKLTERYLFLTRAFLHEFDTALVHFNIPLDPDQHYFWQSNEAEPGFGLNVTGYENVVVDNALDKGNRVARCEPTARKNAYAPVFQNIARDAPMVFLFAPTRILNADARVENLAPSSFAGAFWNLNQWEVAP